MRNSFGSFLRKVRRSKGLTQRELARRIGVNFTYLSKVENDTPGFSSLSEETLRKMAKALDEDPDEMMARSGKIPSDVRRILVDDFSLIKEIRIRYGAPEDEHAPPEDEHAPPEDERVTPEGEHAPPEDEHVLARDKHAPARDKHAPAKDEHDPPKKRDALPKRNRRKSHDRQK